MERTTSWRFQSRGTTGDAPVVLHIEALERASREEGALEKPAYLGHLVLKGLIFHRFAQKNAVPPLP
jgi:hypothetical protein